MSNLDREFSYLCEGSEDDPHPALTAHKLGYYGPPFPPVCPTCERAMRLIQSEFDRKLTDQIGRGR